MSKKNVCVQTEHCYNKNTNCGEESGASLIYFESIRDEEETSNIVQFITIKKDQGV